MVNFQVYEGQSSNLIVFLVGKLLLIDHNKGFWPIDSFTAISIRWWYHRHILTTNSWSSSTGCHQLTMKETATISNGHCPHSACHGPLNIMSDFRPLSVTFLLRTSGVSQPSRLGWSDLKSRGLWKGYHSLLRLQALCQIFWHQKSKSEISWPHCQSNIQPVKLI